MSRRSGRVSGIVYRSKKVSLDPPVLASLERRKGATLDTFSQPVVQAGYSGIRRSLDSLLAAGFLGRLFLASLPSDGPNESAFLALCDIFESLNRGLDARIAGLWGQQKLLGCLGLAPQLHACVECEEEKVVGFSALEGGVLCAGCLGQNEAIRLSGPELSLAKVLSVIPLQGLSEDLLDPEGVRLAGRIYKAQFQVHLELSSDYFKRVLPRRGEKQ